jgi:hypothetical protein
VCFSTIFLVKQAFHYHYSGIFLLISLNMAESALPRKAVPRANMLPAFMPKSRIAGLGENSENGQQEISDSPSGRGFKPELVLR